MLHKPINRAPRGGGYDCFPAGDDRDRGITAIIVNSFVFVKHHLCVGSFCLTVALKLEINSVFM